MSPLSGSAAVVRGYPRACLCSDKWLRCRNRQMGIRLFKYCGICKFFIVKRTQEFPFSTLSTIPCSTVYMRFLTIISKIGYICTHTDGVVLQLPSPFLFIFNTWVPIKRRFDSFTLCEVCTSYCQKYSCTCLDRHVNFSDVPFLNHRIYSDGGWPVAAIAPSALLGRLHTTFRKGIVGFCSHSSFCTFMKSHWC